MDSQFSAAEQRLWAAQSQMRHTDHSGSSVSMMVSVISSCRTIDCFAMSRAEPPASKTASYCIAMGV
jgi:hypothetical protein|eukprot:COSAG01_NODE_1550_length_9943_cov_233.259651_18_plen_67_part_00